jgi:type III secretory pathway component EscR
MYDIELRRKISMANLNEVELQHVRHLLQFSESDIEKFNSYAQSAQDQNVKDFFQKSAQSCEKNRQTILQFLQ